MSTPRSETNVLLVCVTVLVGIVVLGASLAYVLAPEGRDPTILVTVLVATLAPTVAAMAAVVKVGGVSAQVADVAADTNQLTNGLGDSKIRAAVADVLSDDMVDPGAREQLVRDRARISPPGDHE